MSVPHVHRFLSGPDADDVYGFGFFCDAYGPVYLVADTEQYHCESLSEYEARFGQVDREVFRWNIGNWKYPGGLFASSSAEQREFDIAWKSYEALLRQLDDDTTQSKLEAVCVQVLRALYVDGVFTQARRLKGLTVLGPDATDEMVLNNLQQL
jgi:hypothetical protein